MGFHRSTTKRLLLILAILLAGFQESAEAAAAAAAAAVDLPFRRQNQSRTNNLAKENKETDDDDEVPIPLSSFESVQKSMQENDFRIGSRESFTLASLSKGARTRSTKPFHKSVLRALFSSRCNGLPSDTGNKINTKNGHEGPPKGCAVWVYGGWLTDPFTGRRICQVEGLELVRCLAEHEYPKHKKKKKSDTNEDKNIFKGGRLGDLRVRQTLFPQKNQLASTTNTNSPIDQDSQDVQLRNLQQQDQDQEQQPWDYACTLLSRKLFCYRNPPSTVTTSNVQSVNVTEKQKIGQGPQLLQEIQIRAGVGKKRKVDVEEAVAVYDTATTYISRQDGTQMIVQSEFPNGRCITSTAESQPQPQPLYGDSTDKKDKKTSWWWWNRSQNKDQNQPINRNNIDFTIYGKMSKASEKGGVHDLPPLPPPRAKEALGLDGDEEDLDSQPTPLVRPPRSKLVQFGRDSPHLAKNRFGARETYSFDNLDTLNTQEFEAEELDEEETEAPWYDFILEIFRTSPPPSARKKPPTIKSTSRKTSDSDSSSPPTVRYTRYGECPPWYGPNKMCTLELVGQRVDSLREAPPVCAQVASHLVPGFASVHAPIVEQDTRKGKKKGEQVEEHKAAREALEWFRNGGLKVEKEDDEIPLVGVLGGVYAAGPKQALGMLERIKVETLKTGKLLWRTAQKVVASSQVIPGGGRV